MWYSMKRILICSIALGYIIFFIPETEAFAQTDPRFETMETALLQQLKPVIMKSLREIYKEQYSQFNCEQILSINERLTINKNKEEATSVDAIHGAQYFEIVVSLCRPDGNRIQMFFKNDTVNAQYYLVSYKIE